MRRITAVSIVLALAGCVDPADPADPDDELTEVVPPDGVLELAPDPSGVATGGWCYGNYVWNGTSARVYWPANGGCDSTVYSPLVVMLNGFGFSHTDYHYLLRHLAKNGYIGVSIDAIPDGVSCAAYDAAATKAWDFVHDFMWTAWSKRFFINPAEVALIGHSRGGETIRHIAEDLEADPIFHVSSIISLAPTEHCAIAADGDNTDSAMVLVGSIDEDNNPERAYQVYDRGSSEASQSDPGANSVVIWKAMKLIEGAGHGAFGVDGSNLSKMTQGYALAFLHAHLKHDLTYYEDYIRGEAVPWGGYPSVTTQYSDGLLRRVIDNFEDGAIGGSTIGGGLSYTAGTAAVLDLGTSNTTPHDTWALRYTPTSTTHTLSWSIPAAKRDVTGFKYLSVRIGQVSGVATDHLRVRVVNNGVTSPWVWLTDHGTLAQHMNMCLAAQCASQGDQAHMGTIRIPLEAFGLHDAVSSVEVGANADALDGEYYLDSVEFSEWIAAP
jgi:pimeloyl-ACP methyl ester carboxylesterase